MEFLAVQQNINNRTEEERNSEKIVDFTKTLNRMVWRYWYDHREHPIEAGDTFCEDITTEDSKLKRLNSSHTANVRTVKARTLYSIYKRGDLRSAIKQKQKKKNI